MSVELKALALVVGKVVGLLRVRLGPENSSRLELSCDPGALTVEVDYNMRCFEKVASYLTHVKSMAPEILCESEMDKLEYMTGVTELAELQTAVHAPGAFALASSSSVSQECVLGQCALELETFVRSVGRPLLHAHTKAFVTNAVSIIMASPPECQLGALHSQALLATSIEEVAPLLLVGLDFKGAVPTDPLHLTGDAIDKDVMKPQNYRMKLEHLGKFAEMSNLTEIHMPMVRDSQQQPSPAISLKHAMAIMRATEATTDLVTFVAVLHSQLVPKLGNPTKSFQDYLLGYGCWLLKAFQAALDEAETLLKDAQAVDGEVAGWQLPPPLATMRCWRESLSIYAGFVQKSLLVAWMTLLNDQVSSTKAATPSWQIAFQGDGDAGSALNLTLAMKAFGTKLNLVVKAHNDLHELLRVVLGMYGWAL